eukprot:GGOE01001416.1.p1 GENE.GGOE01001416.1~~GGOE01001416.1.p1  ORF type:complete len:397 (-),score=60.49 GGOE01001416.1:657-1847(-)
MTTSLRESEIDIAGDLKTFDERQLDITIGSFAECRGPFGQFGFEANPQTLAILGLFRNEYVATRDSEAFMKALGSLCRHWVGRPTPIFHARHLSREIGGGQIYLKREDLGHTGIHKINHCLGEALLAKYMNKRRIVTETSGTHGICLASAAACVGVECEIYIGANDWEARHADIVKMRMMGAKVIKVSSGSKNLKEAADKAFDVFINDAQNTFYAYSTIAGPQPFPNIVKDLQAIVGEEAREQIQTLTGRLPHHVCGCVAGGSNALGIFQSFLTDEEVKLHAVDHELPTDNAVNLANPGAEYMKGFTMLRDINYVAASSKEAADAFLMLTKHEGIMPNWEAAYALAQAIKLAAQSNKDEVILVSLSGRADQGDISKALQYGDSTFEDEEPAARSDN